jgi:hypothetical protein
MYSLMVLINSRTLRNVPRRRRLRVISANIVRSD